MYWIDRDLNSIDVIDVDGSNHQTLYDGLAHDFNALYLDVAEQTIYVSDVDNR